MDDQETKQTIAAILKGLQQREDLSVRVALVGLGVALGLGILTYILGFGLRWAAIVGVSASALVGFGAAMISETARTRAFESYCEKFPPYSTERSAADGILSSLEQPRSAAYELRKKLGVKSAEQARREEQSWGQVQAAMSRRKRTQNTWTITDAFKCGSCDSYVDWRQRATNCICPRCKATLFLPAEMACPSCGGLNVAVMSKPRVTGKFAGLLMYGPAGLVAGSALDSVKDGLERSVRQKVRNPVFCCESCKTFWGIKLPSGTLAETMIGE